MDSDDEWLGFGEWQLCELERSLGPDYASLMSWHLLVEPPRREDDFDVTDGGRIVGPVLRDRLAAEEEAERKAKQAAETKAKQEAKTTAKREADTKTESKKRKTDS